MILVDTPRGPAGLDRFKAKGKRRAILALGHGAGGDITAPDLTAVRDAAVAIGIEVLLVTQPYRVAGKRAPAPAAALDEAWSAVLSGVDRHGERLREQSGVRSVLPLFVGGRSSGARVACRTALAVGAAGVVALAFPLHPPGKPERSRADELHTGVPTLVVNGDRDAFGMPKGGGNVQVVVVPGATHDLRKDLAAVAEAVVAWFSDQRL